MHRTRLKPKPPEADKPASTPAPKAAPGAPSHGGGPADADDEYSRAPTLDDEGPRVHVDDDAEGELLD